MKNFTEITYREIEAIKEIRNQISAHSRAFHPGSAQFGEWALTRNRLEALKASADTTEKKHLLTPS